MDEWHIREEIHSAMSNPREQSSVHSIAALDVSSQGLLICLGWYSFVDRRPDSSESLRYMTVGRLIRGTQMHSLVVVIVMMWPVPEGPAAEAKRTFEADVRPILKAHCFQCHEEDSRKEGNLDARLVW